MVNDQGIPLSLRREIAIHPVCLQQPLIDGITEQRLHVAANLQCLRIALLKQLLHITA
jgi:hypothetical protein